MTEQKMNQMTKWFQDINVNLDKLEMQDKIKVAGIMMEMLEKLEPIYDKYNKKGSI